MGQTAGAVYSQLVNRQILSSPAKGTGANGSASLFSPEREELKSPGQGGRYQRPS